MHDTISCKSVMSFLSDPIKSLCITHCIITEIRVKMCVNAVQSYSISFTGIKFCKASNRENVAHVM